MELKSNKWKREQELMMISSFRNSLENKDLDIEWKRPDYKKCFY